MSKPIHKQTNDEIRARINKGQALLNAEHKVLFAAWSTAKAAETGRSIAKFTKPDLIAAYTELAELYRKQEEMKNTERFDDATLTLKERTQRRAAAIRARMAAARDQAIKTGKAVKVSITGVQA